MKKTYEVFHKSDFLCDFGYDAGFTLKDDCNINTNSYSNLGRDNRYELPYGIQSGTEAAKSYLAGSSAFKV